MIEWPKNVDKPELPAGYEWFWLYNTPSGAGWCIQATKEDRRGYKRLLRDLQDKYFPTADEAIAYALFVIQEGAKTK